MSLPYANIPQAFDRWQQAQTKAASSGLVLEIDTVEMRIKNGTNTWYNSDDLESIHIALDAYAAALAAQS